MSNWKRKKIISILCLICSISLFQSTNYLVGYSADSEASVKKAIERPYFPSSENEKKDVVSKADSLLKEYSEDEWLNLVPKQAPRRNVPSPVKGYDLKEDWDWDSHNPDIIKDKASGITFPNEQYPPEYISVKVLSGKTVDVPVWRVKNPVRGNLSLVYAKIDCFKTDFMTKNLPILATAYEITGDEKYARRVAIAFDAWATVIPDYFMSKGWNLSQPLSPEEAEQFGWKVERASTHNGVAHEMEKGQIVAFDRIYNSHALKDLSKEKGYDVREHVKNDMFLNIVDFMMKKQPMDIHLLSNLSGPYVCSAMVATTFNRPDIMEWLERYTDLSAERNIMRDGMYPESFSYHMGYGTVNLEVINQMAYYYDVYGANSKDAAKIKAKLDSKKAFMEKTTVVQNNVAFPDGDLTPFGDTRSGGAPTRDKTESYLLPAYGHVMLGSGQGKLQTQMNMAFNDHANHLSSDILSFTLFAFGRELIGDTRYCKDIPGRNFGNSTMGHNTVAINQDSQYRGTKQVYGNDGHLFVPGRIATYEPGTNGIAVSEVDGSKRYPGTSNRYQRMTIMNTMDQEHPYMIDLFKVKGGQTHDYFLHGSTTFEETATSSLALTPIEKEYPLLNEGEEWVEPTHEYDERNWYGMFRNMSTAKSNGSWNVTFKDAENGSTGTKIFMVDDGNMEVYLGKSPAPYRNQAPKTYYDYWSPALMVRHQDMEAKNLDSFFVGVIEPLNGESAIESVKKLPLKEENSEFIALSIKFKSGREDVCLINMNNPSITDMKESDTSKFITNDGKYSLQGRIGILSRSGQSERTYLLSGNKFSYDKKNISMNSSNYMGLISESTRIVDGAPSNALITDINIPEGDGLKGKWLSLKFGKYNVIPDSNGNYPFDIIEQWNLGQMYQIDHVERHDGKTYICLTEDPELSIKDGIMNELMRPQRTFTGPFGFNIDLSTTK